MKLNGEIMNLTAPISLQALLLEQGYHDQRIAVECNGQIIPKSAYEKTKITNDDIIEIVSFVGGG